MERHIIFPAKPVGGGAPLRTGGDEAGVVELDAKVDTEDEEAEVDTCTYAITPGYLLIELIPAEDASGLLGIIAYSPYISRIGKGGEFQVFPHFPSVLEVEVEPYITGLQVVDQRIAVASERTGSEGTGLPSAHAVATAGEVALLKGDYLGIEVRHYDAECGMVDQLVLGVEELVVGDGGIALGVLRKGDIP